MTRRLVPLALLALALAPLSVPRRSAAATAPRYTVVDLDTLGGRDTFAHAVNNLGQVVGWAETRRKDWKGRPIQRAFLWTAGRMQDLGSLPHYGASVAYDVNDRAQVVGRAYYPGWGRTDAVLWTAHEGMRRLPDPPDSFAFRANAINNDGAIVGWGISGQLGRAGAYLWRDGRGEVLFVSMDGADARGINDGLQIAGVDGGASGDLAILIPAPGQSPQSLQHIAYEDRDAANAINNHGTVVGQIHDTAFRWEDGRLDFLRRLGGYCSAEATAINDLGAIVGCASDGGCGAGGGRSSRRAVLWEGERVFDLNDFILQEASGGRWTLERATDINNRGEIAVVGGQRDRKGRLLRQRALLLRPVEGR